MPSNKKKFFRGFAPLLVLVPVLLVAACQSNAQEAAGGYPPPPVEVLTVQPQAIPVTREYVGQTMGSREVEIHARVTGIIEARLYEEGAVVAAGQPLFRIDPLPFEVRVASAEAQLAQARAQFSRADRERKRLEPLAEANAVSRKEIDDARSDAELAAAAVKLAEAALRDARIQLDYTVVKAPLAGITGIAHKFEGALVTAGADSLLTTMVQTDPMDVHFSISENEWLSAQRESANGTLTVPEDGALEVRIQLADGSTLERVGRINFSAARIDTTTGTYSLRARFDNADGALKAGQFVRVEVAGAHRPNAVAVPQKAVLEGPQGKFVFVVGEGENGATIAEFRPVEVGEWVHDEAGEMWVVRSGLAAGDQVILDNFVKIQPGAPVAVIEPDVTGTPAVAVATSAL
ncbi:MAG: efflux RND transporter periplasmic adaptor subunit [Proteobacteria bacterium]|nr:efflux RND transporter periplasmic adaptor subunit [Pseudomonadota bacterium]